MRIARVEQGCREYVMAADPIESDRVVLSGRVPATFEVVERRVWRYEVAAAQIMG